MLIDRLGEQRSHVTQQVFDHAPLRIDFAAEIPSGVPVRVDEGLEADSEPARIAEDRAVCGWDPRSAGVHVQARVEGRMLVGSTSLDDPVATADGPHPAAKPVSGLEHGDPVAGAPELKSGNEAGDACAK